MSHVAGMARAGTSWVAEMLRAAGGLVHLNEPFNPKRPPGQSPGILNAAVPVGYIYVADHNADEFRPALHDTFRFRYRHRAELRKNHTWFDLAKMAKYSSAFTMGAVRRKRPLLDDPYASLAAPWIAEEFDGQVALLVRHPAAMVASQSSRLIAAPTSEPRVASLLGRACRAVTPGCVSAAETRAPRIR